FSANPITGTGSLHIPIATSPGRSGVQPNLALVYDSGAGNGPFGLGFQLSVPKITRKTDKGLPRYDDANESDVFILSEAEDLVPTLLEKPDNDPSKPKEWVADTFPDGDEVVQRYRPRVEGLFARVEKRRNTQTGVVYWRAVTKDNVESIYGRS